jgi:hypothetical protein
MKRKGLSVGLVAVVIATTAVVYWYAVGKEQHELQRRRHQVTDVLLACMMYADKHGNRTPGDLRDLGEIYGQGHTLLTRAIDELELVSPNARTTDNSDAVLIREKQADAKGRRMFGYLDGHALMLGADGHPIHPQPREPGVLPWS